MGKKAKLPAFWTDPVDMEPFFNLKAKRSCENSFGLHCDRDWGETTQNRYEGKARGEIGTGTLWVEYQAEFKAPLEKNIDGYSRLADADHVWRDLMQLAKVVESGEEVRAIIDQDNEKYVAELVAEDLKKNPPKKQKKKGKPKPKPAGAAAEGPPPPKKA